MVERGPEKAGVGGSIPSLGIFFIFTGIASPKPKKTILFAHLRAVTSLVVLWYNINSEIHRTAEQGIITGRINYEHT